MRVKHHDTSTLKVFVLHSTRPQTYKIIRSTKSHVIALEDIFCYLIQSPS